MVNLVLTYIVYYLSPSAGTAMSHCVGCALYGSKGHYLHRLQCDRATPPPGVVQQNGPGSHCNISSAIFFFLLLYLKCLKQCLAHSSSHKIVFSDLFPFTSHEKYKYPNTVVSGGLSEFPKGFP